MPDEILALPEVAQLLKVAKKTVYTMAQRGENRSFKGRGQWHFKRANLDQWIERQKFANREVRFASAPSPSGVRLRVSRRRNDH